MMLHCNICVQPLLQAVAPGPGGPGGNGATALPKFRPMACTKCGHLYHIDCLKSKLSNGQGWTPGKCPAAGCDAKLSVTSGTDVFRVHPQEADKRVPSTDVYQQREVKMLEEKVETLQTRWKLSRKEAGDHRDLVAQQNIYISHLKSEMDQVRQRESQLKEELRIRNAQEEYEKRIQIQGQRSSFGIPNSAMNSMPRHDNYHQPAPGFPQQNLYSDYNMPEPNRPPPGFERINQQQRRPVMSAPGPSTSTWNSPSAAQHPSQQFSIANSNPWETRVRDRDNMASSMRLLQDYMRQTEECAQGDIYDQRYGPGPGPLRPPPIAEDPLLVQASNIERSIDSLLEDQEVEQIMRKQVEEDRQKIRNPLFRALYEQNYPRTGFGPSYETSAPDEKYMNSLGPSQIRTAIGIEEMTEQLSNTTSFNQNGILNNTNNSETTESPKSDNSESCTSNNSSVSEESPRKEENACQVSWSSIAKKANNMPLTNNDNTPKKSLKGPELKNGAEAKGTGGGGGSDKKKMSDKVAAALRSRNQNQPGTGGPPECVYGRFKCKNEDCKAEWGSTLALRGQPQNCMMCGKSTDAYKEDKLKTASELKMEKEEKEKKKKRRNN